MSTTAVNKETDSVTAVAEGQPPPQGLLAKLSRRLQFRQSPATSVAAELVQPQLEAHAPKLESIDQSSEEALGTETTTPEIEYVTGITLYLATGVVSLATFIMLLDTAIVATVGGSASSIRCRLIFARRCRRSQVNSIRFLILAGMEARTFFRSEHSMLS